MRSRSQSAEAGFSLIELMIAMVVTLIVTGAIYGLMAGGQSAFKREPEVSDMQQNLRVSMDVIQRDVATAGIGMGAYYQVFGDALDGAGIVGPAGVNTDHLLIFGNNGECPDMPVLQAPPGPTNGDNLYLAFPALECYTGNQFVMISYGNGASANWGYAFNVHAQDQFVNFPRGQQPSGSELLPNVVQSLASDAGQPPTAMTSLQIIKYEIANDTDGVPSLWRSTTGGIDPATGAADEPAGPGSNAWQLIARGIEDLQVGYRTGASAPNFNPTPGPISDLATDPGMTTMVQEVQVTLQARTITLRGTFDAQGLSLMRNQLTSVSTPRSALNYLMQAQPNPLWR